MSDSLVESHKTVLSARKMLKDGREVADVVAMLDLADASLRFARGQASVPVELIRGYQLSELDGTSFTIERR